MILGALLFGVVSDLVGLPGAVLTWGFTSLALLLFGMLIRDYISAVSIRQAITPDRLPGRVNATSRFIAGGALPIGALAGGALGDVLGLPWTLVVVELGTLLGFVWIAFSPLRTLRALPAVEQAASIAT